MKTINKVKTTIEDILLLNLPLYNGATYGLQLRYTKSKYGEVHGNALSIMVNYDADYEEKRQSDSLWYATVLREELGLENIDKQDVEDMISAARKELAAEGFPVHTVKRGKHIEMLIPVSVYYTEDDHGNRVRLIEPPQKWDTDYLHSVPFLNRGEFYHVTSRF